LGNPPKLYHLVITKVILVIIILTGKNHSRRKGRTAAKKNLQTQGASSSNLNITQTEITSLEGLLWTCSVDFGMMREVMRHIFSFQTSTSQ
jgi:hypothetical protein